MSELTNGRPLTRQGPLDGRVLDGPGVCLTGLPSAAAFNLRADPAADAIDAALKDWLGAPRPLVPNTQSNGARGRILWLGPDEWLVVMPDPADSATETNLRGLLPEEARLCAVGDGLARVAVEGGAGRWLLAAGCPLDPSSPALGEGGCAQTRLAHASVIIVPESAERLLVYVRRSMARYLWTWLETAVTRLEGH